jgi:phosphoribosylglycinamide formyltransferase-1
MPRQRVAILISGRGSNMDALIAATKQPDYPAEIALVLSNVPTAAGIEHARQMGIATAVVERAVQAELEAHRIDIVCLAGFLRLLTPFLVRQWDGRMLNIHPALLPAFKGLDTHARALEAGAKQHGATVHFVVPEMDAGPILAQAAVPVLPDDTEATLAARVLAAEHQLYPQALRLLAAGRVTVRDGQCLVDGIPVSLPAGT